MGTGMKIVIVEDEPAAARQLSRMLSRAPGLIIAGIDICPTIEKARERLAHPLDLLFLDLNVMGQPGMELLKEFLSGPFDTIVATAYPEHALSAFEHGVRDYLVKPFSQERLEQALSRVPGPSPDKSPAMTSILIKEKQGIVPVPVGSIILIRSAGDYCEIHLVKGGVKLCSRGLDFLERRLPEDFIRVHRTAIARLSRIKSMKVEQGGKYTLTVEGINDPTPVGRKYYKELKERLGEDLA
ncbi:MAG: response regulator transcription factor [Nitrospinae bacterium]|nr:response regulator transcription factor [Nitrospinota bacterium]